MRTGNMLYTKATIGDTQRLRQAEAAGIFIWDKADQLMPPQSPLSAYTEPEGPKTCA